MRKRMSAHKLVLLVSIFILALVVIYSGLQVLESTLLRPTGSENPAESKTIVRDGVSYYPRQDITVVMVSGIDLNGPVKSSGTYNNPGAADMVSLLVFDQTNEKINVISINRDTMMEIPVLGMKGRPAGTIHGQLALAHTYGTGLADSSVNLRNAVSNFLYGTQINYYVTMNMDAISIMNDAVGGVTVNVTDDFSEIDSTIPLGQVTLTGSQAVNYVRGRRGVGDGLNLNRMERHKAYMAGFLTALDDTAENSQSSLVTAFEEAGPYMVTDCNTKILASLMDRYGDYELGEILSVEGENVKGEQYMEYHVDEKALDKLILEYLYAPKK